MKACCVAAAFAAFVIVFVNTAPSSACTTDRCAEPTTAVKRPLQLIEQSTTARTSQQRHKRSRAAEPASVEEAVSAASTETVDPGAPLPVRTVRTTRVRAIEEDAASLVMSGGVSDNLRIEALPSLLASTIVNYLGGPAQIKDTREVPVSTEVFPAEARDAFAAEPAGQKPSEVALEYILITFGGALAAASAIRLFLI
jgi:hypothetical protein